MISEWQEAAPSSGAILVKTVFSEMMMGTLVHVQL